MDTVAEAVVLHEALLHLDQLGVQILQNGTTYYNSLMAEKA